MDQKGKVGDHDYYVSAWDKEGKKIRDMIVSANNKSQAGAILRRALRTAEIIVTDI